LQRDRKENAAESFHCDRIARRIELGARRDALACRKNFARMIAVQEFCDEILRRKFAAENLRRKNRDGKIDA
jgi:hypothetical protein